jgi:hypothetical protein
MPLTASASSSVAANQLNIRENDMKNIRASVALFLLAVFLAATAHANTSSVNPNVPAQNSPLSSSVLRGNFAATQSDLNTLFGILNLNSNELLGTINAGNAGPLILPPCAAGALSWTPAVGFGCNALGGGSGSSALSAITGAVASNSIENGAFTQTWAFDALTTQTAIDVTGTGVTTGALVKSEATNPSGSGYAAFFRNTSTATGYGLYATEDGAANTGYAGYFNNTATATGYALYANGTAQINGSLTVTGTCTGCGSGNPTSLAGITTGFSDANYGTVTAEGSPLYRNNAGGVSGLTYDASVKTAQRFEAANMLALITERRDADPYINGAVCNAQESDAAVMAVGSNQLFITGHTFTSAEINEAVAVNDTRSSGASGTGETTITSIGPSGAYAVLAANSTYGVGNGFAKGWVVWGHDDSNAIQNAVVNGVFYGSLVHIPDHCLFHDIVVPSGAHIVGNAKARLYTGSGGYNENTIYSLPVEFYLGTGYADGNSKYMWDVTHSTNVVIEGLAMFGAVFPFGNDYAGSNGGLAKRGTFIGSDTGNVLVGLSGGYVDQMVVANNTFSNLWNGVGGPYASANSGFMSGKVLHNEFINMGWGIKGKWVDFNFDQGNVYTGGYAHGAVDIEPGSAGGSIEGGRAEEIAGINNTTSQSAFWINGGVDIHISNVECQFNYGACLQVSGPWSGVSWSGGFMEGDGVSLASAQQAHVIMDTVNGSGGALNFGGLTLSNVIFYKHNYNAGGDSKYIVAGTANLAGATVDIEGGSACTNGFTTSLFSWAGSAPTNITVNTADCPKTRAGQSDYSIVNGQVGIGTATPTAGVALDMLSNTTSANSSVGLPKHSSANRPGTPVAGMFGYNSDIGAVEVYAGSAWNQLPSVTTGAAQPGYVMQSTTTGTDAAQWVPATSGITWPTSASLVISNATSSPAGLAPVNGDCVVGSAGAWVAGSCSGTASINLGSSTTGANPQITGDATSGFYTPAAQQIGMVLGGNVSALYETTTGAVNYPVFLSEPTGTAAVWTIGGTDTNGTGLGIAIKALTATATGIGGAVAITSGNGLNTGAGGAASFTGGAGGTSGAGGALTFTAGNGGASAGAGGALSFTSGSGQCSGCSGGAFTIASGNANNATGPAVNITAGSTTSDRVGGSVNITGGIGPGNASAGGVNITGGANTDAAAASASGGPISITGGSNTASASFTNAGGGAVTVQGGGSNNGAGGAVTIKGANAAGSANNNGGAVTIQAGSKTGTGAQGVVIINTAGATLAAEFDGNQHRSYGGAAPAISSCGTSPSVDAHATDTTGTATVGSGSPTSCTITFNKAYATWNHCRITPQSALASFAYSYSLSAITINGAALSGQIDWTCDGQ